MRALATVDLAGVILQTRGNVQYHNALSCLLTCWIVICAGVPASAEALVIGDERLGIVLDNLRNYALKIVFVNGSTFPSGGKFPCFVLYDEDGREEEFSPWDSRWKVTEARLKDGVRITYSYTGFRVDVAYRLDKGMIVISAIPRAEGKLKVRALTDGGSLVSVPSSFTGAEASGFIIRPHLSGELIRFPTGRKRSSAIRSAGSIRPASSVWAITADRTPPAVWRCLDGWHGPGERHLFPLWRTDRRLQAASGQPWTLLFLEYAAR